jgi:hypothetical protein
MPQRLIASVLGVLTLCATVMAGVAQAQSVQVTAALPNTGAQGTTALLVKISGKNFAPGAKADFLLSGTTNPDGIVVRGTQWVSATEVDATIDIADMASLAYFDITVSNTNGRSGKGSDMFQVVKPGQNASNVNYTYADTIAFRDAPVDPAVAGSGDAIRSDGTGAYGNGITGVVIKIFTGGSGDLVFTLGTTRLIWADLVNDRLAPSQGLSGPHPNASVQCSNGSAGANVGNIWGIAIGTTVTRPAVFGCNALSADDSLRFGIPDGSDQYSYQVNVHRISKTEWVVTTDGTPAEAVYSTDVSLHPKRQGLTAQYILPFQFDVVCALCAGK